MKIVDGRELNGHFWVLIGSLSNLEFALRVTDTSTGIVKAYQNAQGMLASFGDTSAFE